MSDSIYYRQLSQSTSASPTERAGLVENDDFDRQTPSISVCIVCHNEADKLGPCLQSVAWADEILVMDLSSTDDSVTVAETHGARVIRHAPFPIVEPLRNELAAFARGEWVLALDPDERVTPILARELRRLASRSDIDAVVIPRMNIDLGYAPSTALHRYEPQLRMYRRSRVTWPNIPNVLPTVAEEHKHYLPKQDDYVIVHDRSRTIPEVVDRVFRYAPAQAQSMVDQGMVFSAKAMMLALVAQVDKEFFRGQAWKDGVPGILRAGILVAYKFYVWAAFWQLSGTGRTANDDRLIRRIGIALVAIRQATSLAAAGYRLVIRALRKRD